MTGGVCRNPEHRASWQVVQRNGNASAFNGYRWTPSDYSAVRCPVGGAVWRTKAAYVASLPDAPADWHDGVGSVEQGSCDGAP